MGQTAIGLELATHEVSQSYPKRETMDVYEGDSGGGKIKSIWQLVDIIQAFSKQTRIYR